MVAVTAALPVVPAEAAETAPANDPLVLFNGKDLAGWVNVNGAPDTWAVRDGLLVGSGRPRGFLQTEKMYENYMLELEWWVTEPKSSSGVLLHADALPAVGVPYPRAVAVPIRDGAPGRIVGIQGGAAVPLSQAAAAPGGSAVGRWTRYVITSKDGALDLAVNGQRVARVQGCSPRKGYIGLQAEAGEVRFRHLRLTPLPSSNPPAGQVARADDGLRSIFDGVSFTGWQLGAPQKEYWSIQDGVLRCRGKVAGEARLKRDLWTEREYTDCVVVADWRLPMKPERRALPVFTPDGLFARDDSGKPLRREILDAGDSGIFLRGNTRSQVNIWSQPMGSGDINDYHKDAKLPQAIRQACVPRKKADAPFGQWNRFVITMRGDRVTVVLNGETVIDRAELPGVPARGRLGLQYHGDPVEFRNLFLKPLD